jgi:hypothetical protein
VADGGLHATQEGGCDQPLLLPALVHSSLVAAEERFGRTVEEVSSDVTSTTTEETEEEDDEVFTAEVVDPAPCKRRRLLKPLTLTPEDCLLCGPLPLNMNLNNNHPVAMAVLASSQPHSPVRTEHSIFSPEYGERWGCGG